MRIDFTSERVREGERLKVRGHSKVNLRTYAVPVHG